MKQQLAAVKVKTLKRGNTAFSEVSVVELRQSLTTKDFLSITKNNTYI